ncbi:MAG: hypothetical protein JNK82_05830 [Myxococcaceae bacterium]|nr:hypothetical protein [Myxococcaceae bacterium]
MRRGHSSYAMARAAPRLEGSRDLARHFHPRSIVNITGYKPQAARTTSPSQTVATVEAPQLQQQADAFVAFAPPVVALGGAPAVSQVGGVSAATPVTAAGTRPEGWVSVASEPLSGEQLTTNANGVAQPAESGWYMVSCDVGAGADHTSIAYYDAALGEWTYSTSIQGGASVPVAQSDLATNPTQQFYPITMGPAVGGTVTEAEWSQLMMDDLQQLSASYGSMGIAYNVFAPNTNGAAGVDGNCNTYTAYLLAGLGGTPPTHEWFPGMDLVSRDASGAVNIASHTQLGSWIFTGGNLADRFSGQFTQVIYRAVTPDLSADAG